MEENKANKRLSGIIAHTYSVSDKLQQASSYMLDEDYEKFSEAMLNAEIESEIICRNLRKYLIMSSITNKDDLYGMAAENQNIGVEHKDNEVKISMVALPLKKRTNTNCDYIVQPLLHSLKAYATNHNIPKFSKCKITIKHIYPDSVSVRHISDYDNIEIKKVIDVIALFLLTDDNMALCDVMHTSEIGDDFKTEIIISER